MEDVRRRESLYALHTPGAVCTAVRGNPLSFCLVNERMLKRKVVTAAVLRTGLSRVRIAVGTTEFLFPHKRPDPV